MELKCKGSLSFVTMSTSAACRFPLQDDDKKPEEKKPEEKKPEEKKPAAPQALLSTVQPVPATDAVFTERKAGEVQSSESFGATHFPTLSQCVFDIEHVAFSASTACLRRDPIVTQARAAGGAADPGSRVRRGHGGGPPRGGPRRPVPRGAAARRSRREGGKAEGVEAGDVSPLLEPRCSAE